MGDYNLAGLHPREFEHLIQALAIRVIAPGVHIFGDGRDGGREATYEGRMNYPSVASPWDGYLVIQAKFLQRPSQTSDQGSWALGQLRLELQKYSSSTSTLRKPEYLIFATNAVMTPVAETGSIDRADSMLRDYGQEFGLLGHEIWHYDTICRLLDGQEDIRRQYAGFISTGDVLAQVIASIEDRTPIFESVMVNFLQKQLVADQNVSLGQAGCASEDKTSLAQVFVDLSVTEEHQVEPPVENLTGPGQLPAGFVAQVLCEVGEILIPRILWEREDVRRVPTLEAQITPGPGRYVLVGGPGQGKTTIGQYICQIHRQALLRDRPSYTLSIEARKAISEIQRHGESDGLKLEGARRYPIRIVLSRFADSLASGSVRSLLGYIASTIAHVVDCTVTVDEIRTWLGRYPWLLVLDGLDEVPATSNRAEVMAAIEAFWVEVADSNADIFVVATTRPQGYEKEFSAEVFCHRHLALLSSTRAIRYTEKLAESRYPADADGRNRVLERLKKGAAEPATARLMRTPLQVTIMALLVERLGDPPGQRWPLFQKYFEVIYDRELAKGGPVASLLRTYRQHIETIHHRVGLKLQLDSEQAGANESSMGQIEFEALVKTRLTEVGFGSETIAELADKIAKATMQRLIFLIAPVDYKIGFEIRSLQEFMAGEALVNGNDEEVGNRLKAIAPAAYWRNTFLFAAGHRFSRREYDFESVLAICDSLNEAGPFGTMILSGSRLALDLLEDGLAREHPYYQKALTRKALLLLRLPPDGSIDRLAGLMEPENEGVYFEEINDRLNQSSIFPQLSAWKLLNVLAFLGSRKAQLLFDSKWPVDPECAFEVCRVLIMSRTYSTAQDPLVQLVPHITYDQIIKSQILPPSRSLDRDALPNWFVSLCMIDDGTVRIGSRFQVPVNLGQREEYNLELTPIGDGPHRFFAALSEMPVGHQAWAPIISAARFVAVPSARTLGEALRSIATQWSQQSYRISIPSGLLPWPLSACISSSQSSDEYNRLAARAEAGELGDLADWLKAEERWREVGLSRASLEAMTDEHWPFDLYSLQFGLPFKSDRLAIKINPSLADDHEALIQFYETLSRSHVRSELADAILGSFGGFVPAGRRTTVKCMLDLVRDLEDGNLDIKILMNFENMGSDLKDWVELFDLVGDRVGSYGFYTNTTLPKSICAMHVLNPERRGLVKLLGMLVLHGYDIPLPADWLTPHDSSDPSYSAYCLFIRMSQPNLPDSEALTLAVSAEDLMKVDPGLINHITNILIKSQKNTLAGSYILSHFLANWPENYWMSKGRAITFLAENVQSRRTTLANSIN